MTVNDNDTSGAGSDTGGRGRVGETLETARTRAAEAYETARERTSAAYDTARSRASSAVGSARQGASRAGRRTADEIDANPMGAVVAGLALGAVAAALLPKSRRESEMLGQYGQRINDTAREAARAAREAGRSKLDELGLNRETARQKASELVGSSASAAADAVRSQRQQ